MQNKMEEQIGTQNTKSVGVPKPTEPTIMDFIMRMREKVSESDTNKDTTEDENVFSSQDMINDARARRNQKGKTY